MNNKKQQLKKELKEIKEFKKGFLDHINKNKDRWEEFKGPFKSLNQEIKRKEEQLKNLDK